ncbi:hypothetical protein ACFV30_27005 [Streptomyces sp. NPDC059752]
MRSARAHDYVRRFTDSLDPWRREPQVADLIRRSHLALTAV